MLIALRKKMRAKLSAITQPMPAPFNAIGACSREEPHPKLLVATMMSPGSTRRMKSWSMSFMQCRPNSSTVETLR